jgi:nitrate reductase NapE component
MVQLLESLLFIGTSIAAVAVAVVCVLGLVVWMAGGQIRSRPKCK